MCIYVGLFVLGRKGFESLSKELSDSVSGGCWNSVVIDIDIVINFSVLTVCFPGWRECFDWRER